MPWLSGPDGGGIGGLRRSVPGRLLGVCGQGGCARVRGAAGFARCMPTKSPHAANHRHGPPPPGGRDHGRAHPHRRPAGPPPPPPGGGPPRRARPGAGGGRGGPAGLSNAELIALVWGTGAPGASALDLATEALAVHGGLAGLAAARRVELEAIPGIGAARAARLAAAFELGRRLLADWPAGRFAIRGPRDLADRLPLPMGRLARAGLGGGRSAPRGARARGGGPPPRPPPPPGPPPPAPRAPPPRGRGGRRRPPARR